VAPLWQPEPPRTPTDKDSPAPQLSLDGVPFGVFCTDDREVVVRQWLADAESGRPFDLVFRVLRKDAIGHHVRARAWSMPGGTIGTVEDVTEAEARSQPLALLLEVEDQGPGAAELVRSEPSSTVFRLVLMQGDPDVAHAPSPPAAP